jgi:hypothetical protein
MKINLSIRYLRFVFLISLIAASYVCPATIPDVKKILIFPVPQQMELTDESFILDESVSIVVPVKSSENDIFLARFLVKELSDKYGKAIKIESRNNIPEGRKVIIMGTANNSLIKKYSSDNNLIMTGTDPGPEGYLLQVSDDRIIISGWDDAGAFWGLQSLRQLIESENGAKVPGVKIKDWPNLPFRGIRLYIPGPENIAFFKRFLSDFMALYKFNKVIIELNCMRLDKHPEVNAGWIEFAKDLQYSRLNRTEGIRGELKNSSHYDAGDGFIVEKNDVREIVELANQNFIEVIPEIPSLTHSYYLLTRHPELAEYPGDIWPDTYCPSNPGSYDLIFDVYDEYIEVIHPKMIHIGHDEWRIPLDVCPRCKGKDYSDLYAQDVNRIYNYMSHKGIKVAMWGDHLLESVLNSGPIEATTSTGVTYLKPGGLRPSVVKESIPKDILVFNWFWVDKEKEIELDNFGFTQVYGNFKANISNWDERIKKIDLAGGAPSSWAATNEYNLGKDCLMDFLGCANLLWSTHTISPADLIEVVWELMPSIRSRLSASRIPGEDGNEIVPVDISEYFNLSRDIKIFNLDLSTFKSGKIHNRSRVFSLADTAESSGQDLSKSSGKCLIGVGSIGLGENPLPSVIKGLEINEDVSSLIFLHACALPAMNQKAYYNMPDFFDTPDLLGWYEVIYDDGFREIVPVQYGVNILEWNPGGANSLDKREGKTGSPQNAYCYQADPIICSSDENNNPIIFFAFEWVNPRFGKIIKEINVYGSVNYQGTQAASNPETRAIPANAILLAGISKVSKRTPYIPKE